jgi:hypothetical protein
MNKIEEIKKDITKTQENSFELELSENIDRNLTKQNERSNRQPVEFDHFFFDNFSNMKLDLLQEKFKNIVMVNNHHY